MPVYFVQAGEDGPIKIGFTSRDPFRRLGNLRTGCPVELKPLGYIDGDETTERALHRRFHRDRVCGEWFQPSPDLLAVIGGALPMPRRRPASETAALAAALGGNRELAKIADVGATAVSNWHKQGCIPPRLYFRIRDAAQELGVECPVHLFFREMRAA